MPFNRRRIASILAGATFLIAAAGCHSKSAPTPANFTAALNDHFLDHPDCLFPQSPRFPYETGDPAETARMNALVSAQMLTVQEERDIHVSRYTPTDTGARAVPRFCFGHRVVTGIDSFTPPVQANGFPESQVTYHYSMAEVPVWADSAQMRAAFPPLAYALSGSATDHATLATTITGWQFPD